MKFGITDLKPEEIDFSLPAFNAPRWEISKSTNALKIYTGQPVWSAKGNIGKIYPKGTRPNQFLYYYSRQFNSIELNATYYKIPTQDQVINWRDQTPEDFKFCPKFPKFISHRKNLSEKSDSLDEYLRHIYLFENRLGVSFLQLSPHFSPEHISELKKFIDLLPEDMAFAIEFRHEDWFKNESASIEILNYLHSKNIAAVITDTPGRRDVLHLNLTSDIALIRFKGNNLHPSDYLRIDQWTDRTLSFIDSGIRQVYFFLHQEDESLGIELSQHYLKKLNSELNQNYRFPKILNRQSSLF